MKFSGDQHNQLFLVYRYCFYFSFQLLVLNASAKGRIVHHAISDKAEISIYLPDSYGSNKPYQTIYFNDGETIFSAGYGWELEKKLDRLIGDKIIEPVIVVAIHSKGNRLSLYNPYHDYWIKQNWGFYTPQAIAYTELISETIIPFVEKNYSVKKEVSSRAIFGYSLGGLHATWAGLVKANVFGFSAGLSPSYWVADKAIMNEIISQPGESRFWFDLGTAEWEYYIPFYKKLQQAGLKAGTDCFYYEMKDGGHTAADWIKRIEYPLIAFAGINKDNRPVTMELVFECIPSLSVPGKVYRRVNALVHLANGIRYTLSNTARYSLLKGDIKLGDDGTITAGTESKAEVEVSYADFRKRISFTIDDCGKKTDR